MEIWIEIVFWLNLFIRTEYFYCDNFLIMGLVLSLHAAIYSRLSRSFTARGSVSGEPTKDICMKLAKMKFQFLMLNINDLIALLLDHLSIGRASKQLTNNKKYWTIRQLAGFTIHTPNLSGIHMVTVFFMALDNFCKTYFCCFNDS